MKKTLAGFVLGLLVGAFACVAVLQHTKLVVQDAWIARQDQDSATIRFNHDATDQVVSVRVPIPDFPITRGHQSGVPITVMIWHEADSVTETLMQTNAFEVERMKLRDVVGWKMGPADLYTVEVSQ